MQYLKIRRAKVGLILFSAFLVGLVYLADTGQIRRVFAPVEWIPWGDKLGHFILFGILSFLVNLLFRVGEIRLRSFTVLKGSVLVTIVVTLEECSQVFFPSRTFDLRDLAADFAGIWLAGRLAILYLALRTSSVKPGSLAAALPVRVQAPPRPEGERRHPPE